MWLPNTIQVPTELIRSEIAQEVPAGTTLAAAVFTMTWATTETAKSVMKQYGLDPHAATAAWMFLKNGTTATDGENESEPSAESPTPNTTDSDSVTYNDGANAVIKAFEQFYPNLPLPTVDQITIMLELAENDCELIAKAVENTTYSPKEVNSPPGLVLYTLRNQGRAKIEQHYAQNKRKGQSDDQIVARLQREADAQIATMPKPTVKTQDATLAKLQQLKGLSVGRPR